MTSITNHFKGLFLILALCLSAFVLHAQSFTVSGTIRAAGSKEPLVGATVLQKGLQNGVSTDEKGHFELLVIGERATLTFSSLGFQSKDLRVDPATHVLDIYLAVDGIRIPTTTITAEGLQKVHPNKALHITDYQFIGGHVLVIARDLKEKKAQIEVLDETGTTVHVLDDLKEAPNGFFKDCMGAVHALTPNFAYQLDFVEGELYPRGDSLFRFKETVEPCTAMLDSAYFFTLEPSPYLRHFIFIRADERRKRHLYASLDSVSLMYHQDEALMPSRYVNPQAINSDTRVGYSSSEIGKRDLTHMMLKPPYIPLKIVQGRAMVFDHLAEKIIHYDAHGNRLAEVGIDYHEDKHWHRKIIIDEEQQRAFALYDKNGISTLVEVDPFEGNAIQSWELPKQFVKNIKVREDAIYFLYSDSMYDPVQKLYRLPM